MRSVLPVMTTKETKLCNPEVPSQRRSRVQAGEVSRGRGASLTGLQTQSLAKNPPWIFLATRLLAECLVLSAVVLMVRESERAHDGNLQFTISCLVALLKHESSIPVLAEGYNRRVFLNVSAQYYIGCFP